MFHSATLKAVLSANEKLKHLEEQLVPHMIRYQVGRGREGCFFWWVGRGREAWASSGLAPSC